MPCSVHRYKSNGAPWNFQQKGCTDHEEAARPQHLINIMGCEVRSQDVLENLLYDDEIELIFSQRLLAKIIIRVLDFTVASEIVATL